MDAYKQMNAAAQKGSINSDDFDIHLQQLSARYNISILVLDEDSETIRVSGGDPSILKIELWNHVLFDSMDSGGGSVSDRPGKNQGQKYGENTIANKTLVRNESPFYIVQLVTSNRVSMDYLDMWGFLDNGNLFFIRTALEGIRDSVDIANRFLAYVGIAATIASGIIIWIVTKKVTDPILELARISERMTHLDFDARYQGKSFNETAILGNHINQLADTLEATISELKTANNVLQKDIEKSGSILLPLSGIIFSRRIFSLNRMRRQSVSKRRSRFMSGVMNLRRKKSL